MKSTKLTLFTLLLSALFFSGCTSKYQTNKLPQEEKINIPTKVKSKRFYLNQDVKDDFKKYVINTFNNGIEKKPTSHKNYESNIPKNIWVQGYEIDKKRY